MQKHTVDVVNLSDVLEALNLLEVQDEILENGFDGVSFGDASYTLIGKGHAWHCISSGLRFTDIPEAEIEGLEEAFIRVVGNSYVNLED